MNDVILGCLLMCMSAYLCTIVYILGLVASFNLDVYSISNLMLHFTLITMVYCVAFGCKNRLTKGCGIHFFSIS